MIDRKPLPFDQAALEPVMSARTLHFHYDKHYSAYVEKTNVLSEGSLLSVKSITHIVKNAEKGPLFNNAAQVWNHEFFWNSLSPTDSQKPGGHVLPLIESEYGSVERFFDTVIDVSVGHFGSGWTWAVLDQSSRLNVYATHNAENPLTTDCTPLFALDLWEHAYYLDYQNDRKTYAGDLLTRLLNWDFVNQNLSFTTIGSV